MPHMPSVLQDAILPQETYGCALRRAVSLWEL